MKVSVAIRMACAGVASFAALAVSVPAWCKYVREGDVQKGIPLRKGFVSAYGLYRRLTGARSCNKCVRLLESGQLMLPTTRRHDMAKKAREVTAISEFCRTNGIRFLFVQLPKKLDVNETMLPPGVRDIAYEQADELLQRLAERDVATEDWRPRFAGTSSQVAANFYSSDTHWNNPTSLRAAQDLAAAIARLCGADWSSAAEANRLLQAENWNSRELTGYFFGALLKRTGPFFIAPDDVMALWPKFDTRLTVVIPSMKYEATGSFLEVAVPEYAQAMRRRRAEQVYFSSQYAGRDERTIRLSNPCAPLDRKVLLIGDSFSRSLRTYLWVAVREIVSIDPRHRSPRIDIARLLLDERPDIVIQIPTAAAL